MSERTDSRFSFERISVASGEWKNRPWKTRLVSIAILLPARTDFWTEETAARKEKTQVITLHAPGRLILKVSSRLNFTYLLWSRHKINFPNHHPMGREWSNCSQSQSRERLFVRIVSFLHTTTQLLRTDTLTRVPMSSFSNMTSIEEGLDTRGARWLKITEYLVVKFLNVLYFFSPLTGINADFREATIYFLVSHREFSPRVPPSILKRIPQESSEDSHRNRQRVSPKDSSPAIPIGFLKESATNSSRNLQKVPLGIFRTSSGILQ